MPLVYDELRKLAAAKLAQEKPGQTLQATALVHEAYMRLVGGKKIRALRSQRMSQSRSDLPPASDSDPGTAAGISSRPRPRRCGEFWSKSPSKAWSDRRRQQTSELELDASAICRSKAGTKLLALDEALQPSGRR